MFQQQNGHAGHDTDTVTVTAQRNPESGRERRPWQAKGLAGLKGNQPDRT
jgi:hypothetical protein